MNKKHKRTNQSSKIKEKYNSFNLAVTLKVWNQLKGPSTVALKKLVVYKTFIHPRK